MFKKIKLKKYLLGVFSLMILLTGIITVVAINGLLHTSENTDILVNEILAADAAVKTCRIEANVAARELREMVLTDDKSEQQQLQQKVNVSITTINDQIEIFRETHGEADGLADKYEEAFDKWFAIASRAMDKVAANDKAAATEIILEECSPALADLVTIVGEIDQTTEAAKAEQQQHTLDMLRVFMIACIATFVVALIFGLYVALRTTYSITNAVALIQKAAVELSKGNLKTQVDYDAANEFGELAERMNFSFTELRKYVDAIDYGMNEFSKGNFQCTCPIPFIGDFAHIQYSIECFQKKISDTLLELDHSAYQVNLGAEQVADGAQALAQGATEQASSVEQLSASIEDVSTHISNTSNYAQKANELGQETGNVVENGQEQMKQLLNSIQDIATDSQNIQSIIKAIDDIAFQTNILALNAAVEAARAGVAGKGFAVVASEVRNLAQKSADAAQNTKELIENSLAHVAQGEKIAHQTEVAFHNVAKSANDIVVMVNKIAEASKEQAVAIEQITQGVEQISAVVQTTSAASEQSAAASHELNNQSTMMKTLLNQFTLVRDEEGVQISANRSVDFSEPSTPAETETFTYEDAPISPVGAKY